MSDEPTFGGMGYPIPGSPLDEYQGLINAKLEAGEIPCTCPHPDRADYLYLPEEILCCAECSVSVRQAHSEQSHECALCLAPATQWSRWTTGHVHATVHLCGRCGALSGGPPSLN